MSKNFDIVDIPFNSNNMIIKQTHGMSIGGVEPKHKTRLFEGITNEELVKSYLESLKQRIEEEKVKEGSIRVEIIFDKGVYNGQ